MNGPVQLHQPVLLQECLDYLAIQPTGVYIDATFGRGGHSQAILQRLQRPGWLLALDKDPEAAQVAQPLLGELFKFELSSYARLQAVAEAYHCKGCVNGVLLDCGVSSPQLDDPARGFSFLRDGPLDMRMNPAASQTAAQWLARIEEKTLAAVIKEYGEERYAKRIARAIVMARREKPIERTVQLAEIVSRAHPNWEAHKHPATRTFQAIRIVINNELEELTTCLQASLSCLAPGGRLLVISFHSLEDGIVKKFIRKQVSGDTYPKEVPITTAALKPTMRWVVKKVNPTKEEIKNNPRARSAVLRVAEKLT